MRRALLTTLFILGCSFSAHAELSALSPGQIFGISDGTYAADGTLNSKSDYVPDLSFHSVRKLRDGVIEATTHATLLGIPLATASAQLKVQPTGGQQFDILNVDGNLAKAGSGSCDETSCTFTATVMDGTLTLTETWIATDGGFEIKNCSQTFKGQDATYEGVFTPQ